MSIGRVSVTAALICAGTVTKKYVKKEKCGFPIEKKKEKKIHTDIQTIFLPSES